MPRYAAAIILALLAITPAAAGWAQYRGEPTRTSIVALPSGPLDIVANFTLPPGYTTIYPNGAPGVWTPHGALVFLRGEGTCAVAKIPDPRLGAATVHALEGCEFGGTQLAYDAENDLLFVCISGVTGSQQLRALRADTLELAWGLSAAVLGSELGFTFWNCQGGALDPARDELVLVWYSYANGASSAKLTSIDSVSGEMLWMSAIPPPGSPIVTTPFDLPSINTLGPRTVTLTEDGIVVMSVGGATVSGIGNFYAIATMFDRAGSYTASRTAYEGGGRAEESTSTRGIASHYAVAHGTLAAFALGTDVVVVNPNHGDVVMRAPLQAADDSYNYIWWPTGAWLADRIYIMLPHSVSAVDAVSLATAWTWGEGGDWDTRELITTATGDVLVFTGRQSAGESRLVALDARTGEVRWRLPIPIFGENADGIWDMRILPTGGTGILAFTDDGAGVFIGSADLASQAAIRPSNTHPAVGEEITLSAEAPSGRVVRQMLVHWGDGVAETILPGEPLRHAYAQAGAATHRVTLVYADGLTATNVGTLDVGGTPPPQLTTLQRAFSPDNQELTFFLLGTLITIVGLAVTVGRHRRRYARLERELSAVEEIRMLSTSDPRGAVLALKSYRDRLPDDLARRRIDDSQYHILDLRSGRLLKVLRTRMLAPYDSRLSVRYHRQLDAAFEDAILHPSERDALVLALDAEPALDDPARVEIGRVLDDFTSGRLDTPPS